MLKKQFISRFDIVILHSKSIKVKSTIAYEQVSGLILFNRCPLTQKATSFI